MADEVDIPGALEDALSRDPEAQQMFDALPPSHRREYARWIAQAKLDDTRQRRAARAVELLRAGKETP